MRRSAGTVLMAAGLLMILVVGGYFAWSEIQAAQVQAELDASAASAAQRSTAVAIQQVRAPAEPIPQVMVEPTSTATKRPATVTPVAASPTTAARATRLATRTLQPTPEPTPEPTATPAPTATPLPVEPVRLAIPDLKIDTKVVNMGWEVVQTKSGPVSQWVIPKNAAGHHINSVNIGEPGNLVISGHNNIYGQVFKPISQAWNNDKRVQVDAFTDRSDGLNGREIVLFDQDGREHRYVITEFYRLKDTGVSQEQRIKNGRFILPTEDDRLTIITCWPPTNNTHRLAVIARPQK